MLAIKNNLMAQTASRHLGKSYEHLSTSVERLSSGLRINSAKDDAAGLAVRELIRADVASLQQGSRNAADGVSMLQAAEGALGEIDSILVRMRELAEQASTGTYSSTQKGIMQNEYDELTLEVTRIAETTDFNDINLLQGTGQVEITLGAGLASGQTIQVDKQAMAASDLQLDQTASSAATAETALLAGGEWATGSATGDLAFAFDTAAGAAVGTISVTWDGQTKTAAASTSGVTFDNLIDLVGSAGATGSLVTGASGGLQIEGAATNGAVTDFAFALSVGANVTAHWGADTNGTVIGTEGTYALEVTSATVTEGDRRRHRNQGQLPSQARLLDEPSRVRR
jgi:flagellin